MAETVVDTPELIADLRMCTAYASRVGLLQDPSVLQSLSRAQQAIDRDQKPDVQVLAQALNDVVRLIAPLTIADLRFGRNPLDTRNQAKGRVMQLLLTALALVVLGLIGYFMDSLRKEQEAIATLVEIQQLRPQEKLNSLRTLAQFEKPIDRRSATYEAYQQRVVELRQINGKLIRSYTTAVTAQQIPLFPTFRFLYQNFFDRPGTVNTQASEPVPAEAPGGKEYVPERPLCVVDAHGRMELPPEAGRYPEWLRNLLGDALNDFCFELKVFGASGTGVALSSSLVQLGYLPEIADKVSMRQNWFLPFFYGLLGSIIFVMRNVASLRTPAMGGFQITMRLALGGVAGIVIGWFSFFSGPLERSQTAISLPLALAFLTGYGIEMLFGLLDKLIRASTEPPPRK